MVKKLAVLNLAIAVLFVGIGQVEAQNDMSAADALYWNLSLRQLGVPNPLNEPYYFSSPNAPTQTWHPDGGDMQASVGYLGLFSLTNTDAVMRNLDTILQATGMTSNGAAFDPVYGMRYTNGLVNNAINTAAVSQVNTIPTTPVTSPAPLTNAPIDVGSVATLVVNSGTSTISSGTIGMTTLGGGTLKLTSRLTDADPVTVNAANLTLSGGTVNVAGLNSSYMAATVNLNGGALLAGGTLAATSVGNSTVSFLSDSVIASTGVAIVNGGSVNNIVLSNPGTNYTSATTTTLTGGHVSFVGNTSLQASTLRLANTHTSATLDTNAFPSGLTVSSGTLAVNLSDTPWENSTGTASVFLNNRYTLPNLISNGTWTTIEGTSVIANGSVFVAGNVLNATSVSANTLTIRGTGVVPEPSAFVLLAAAGFVGLFIKRLRRKS